MLNLCAVVGTNKPAYFETAALSMYNTEYIKIRVLYIATCVTGPALPNVTVSHSRRLDSNTAANTPNLENERLTYTASNFDLADP
jgi:hypothetical protein